MANALKTLNGLAQASIKTIDGLALASNKTWNGLENSVVANTHSIDFESGSSQYCVLANNIGIDGGATTHEMWIKLESAPAADTIMELTGQSNTTSQIRYGLRYRDEGGTKKLQWKRTRVGVNGTTISVNTTLNTATWYHIAGNYDTTNLELVLDGVSVAGPTAASSNGSSTSSNFVVVGQNDDSEGASFVPNTGRYPDGLFDEMRFWSVARTVTEIANNKSTEIDAATAGLAAYYKFNNNANDSTASAFNLTETGSPVYSADVAF